MNWEEKFKMIRKTSGYHKEGIYISIGEIVANLFSIWSQLKWLLKSLYGYLKYKSREK